MTHHDRDRDDPGLPRLHHARPPRRSGTRSPSPSGPSATATPGVADYDLRARRAREHARPGAAMREFDGVPDVDHRRRDPRGRSAAQARPDLADADGPGRWRPRASRRLTHEIEPIGDGRHQAHRRSTSSRTRRSWRTCSPAGSRPRAPAAAGRGCSATSSRCSRRGRHMAAGDNHAACAERSSSPRSRSCPSPALVADARRARRGARLGRVLRLGPRRLPRAGHARSPTRGSRWRRSRCATERVVIGPLVTPLAAPAHRTSSRARR